MYSRGKEICEAARTTSSLHVKVATNCTCGAGTCYYYYGQAPLPEGLQLCSLEQHQIAITCATQSCSVSSCLACDGLGVFSCTLQSQTDLHSQTSH